MIIKLYRGIGPGTLLITILTGILVWLYPFIHPVEVGNLSVTDQMPLNALVVNMVAGKPLLSTVIAFILVVLIGIYLSNFNTRLFFITERTLLPMSLYIILSGFIVNMQIYSPILPATLLLVMSIDRLLAAYRKSGVAYNFFDSSLLLGVASLFYFNIIWFFPVILIGVLLIRTFKLREIMLSILGVASPYIVFYAGYYILGKEMSLFTDLILGNIISDTPSYYWSPLIITLFSLGASILILAFIHLIGIYNTKKIRSRKIFSILIWIVVICLVVYFFIPGSSIELIYIILIPYVYIVSHFMVFVRNKKIANVVFAIISLAVFWIQIERVISM